MLIYVTKLHHCPIWVADDRWSEDLPVRFGVVEFWNFGVVKFRNQKSFPVPELNNTEAFTVVHCQEWNPTLLYLSLTLILIYV